MDKSNECYKILEAAKQFVREQEGALSSDQDELTRWIQDLEAEIKKYDQDLADE